MAESPPPDITEAFAAASGRVGHFADRFVYYSVVSSTNDVAARLARSGSGDWTTVLAAAQTAGRGRHGREWYSPPGAGLYFSTVLAWPQSPLVSLMAGVAVAEGIRDETGLRVELKWPNDVVVPSGASPASRLRHAMKVAGILAEAIGEFGVVLGIGINVARADYPQALQSRVTSLEAELGAPVARSRLLVECLARLARWRAVLASTDAADLLNRWRELSPTSEGTVITWNDAGTRRRGVTAGIDPEGALRVQCGHKIERIVGGEVAW